MQKVWPKIAFRSSEQTANHLYTHGPYVYGLLSIGNDTGSNLESIVVNYSWSYLDLQAQKSKRCAIGGWTEALEKSGYLGEEIENWRFQETPEGLIASMQFRSPYAFEGFAKLILFDQTFEKLMEADSETTSREVIGSGLKVELLGFEPDEIWKGAPNFEMFG